MGQLRKRLNALAKADLTGSIREIEANLRIPKSSIARLIKRPEFQELREIQRQELIQQWHETAIEALQESKKLKFRSKEGSLIGGGVATDKIIAIENPPNAQR